MRQALVKPTWLDFERVSEEMLAIMQNEAKAGDPGVEWFDANFEEEFYEKFIELQLMKTLVRLPSLLGSDNEDFMSWLIAMQTASFTMGYEFGKQTHSMKS